MSSVLSPLMAWIRSPGHKAASAALLPAWTCRETSQRARHRSFCGLVAVSALDPSDLRTWAVRPCYPRDLWVGKPRDRLSSHMVLPQPLL